MYIYIYNIYVYIHTGAVRHNFDVRNAKHVQALLRTHGADLNSAATDYTAKLNEYAHTGDIDRIRLLAENKVDVGLGNYDRRTPLHLAACRFVRVCVRVYIGMIIYAK